MPYSQPALGVGRKIRESPTFTIPDLVPQVRNPVGNSQGEERIRNGFGGQCVSVPLATGRALPSHHLPSWSPVLPFLDTMPQPLPGKTQVSSQETSQHLLSGTQSPQRAALQLPALPIVPTPPSSGQLDNAGVNNLDKCFSEASSEGKEESGVITLFLPPFPGGQETGSATTPMPRSPAPPACPVLPPNQARGSPGMWLRGGEVVGHPVSPSLGRAGQEVTPALTLPQVDPGLRGRGEVDSTLEPSKTVRMEGLILQRTLSPGPPTLLQCPLSPPWLIHQ